MRFMMLMIPKGYESAAPGTVPDAKAVEAMMQYNKALQDAGILIALDGLHPPSMGARVSFEGGKPNQWTWAGINVAYNLIGLLIVSVIVALWR